MFVLMTMSETPESASETPVQTPVRRDRSAAARRAARLERAERAARIISLLDRGVSVAEIAACEGLSLKRMRNLVPEIPGEAHASAPAEFLALQSAGSTKRCSRPTRDALVRGGNELRGGRSGGRDRARAPRIVKRASKGGLAIHWPGAREVGRVLAKAAKRKGSQVLENKQSRETAKRNRS